jgi:hypothetical protein
MQEHAEFAANAQHYCHDLVKVRAIPFAYTVIHARHSGCVVAQQQHGNLSLQPATEPAAQVVVTTAHKRRQPSLSSTAKPKKRKRPRAKKRRTKLEKKLGWY